MNTKKTTLLASGLLLALSSYGQGERLGGAKTDGNMSGSASASQGMGGLFSPNLYDGTATVNIPVFQYAVENSNFGVSLSYNTKGVTVDELASDAGLHWMVTRGASISRVKKDLPDEISLIDGDTLLYQASNPYPPSVPYPGYTPADNDPISLNKFWAFKGRYASYFESSASRADQLVYRDNEADDFIVNLGSGSFTFNLGTNGSIFTHPKRNISVEVLWGDQLLGSIGDQQVIGNGTSNLLNFRIRDEQGNTYTFIRSSYAITEITDAYGKSMNLTHYESTSQWVVSKVKLANGSEISYTYYPEVLYGQTYLPPSKSWSKVEGYFATGCGDTTTATDLDHVLKLASIQYPNGTIASFNYDSRKRPDYPYGALREIRVSGVGSSGQCLSYILQQSFSNADALAPLKTYEEGLDPFNTAGGHYNRKLRLRLDGILLNSCDSTVQEPYYRFTYDPTVLPQRFSNQQDYFGYYNGGSTTLITSGSACNEGPIPYHQEWYAQNVTTPVNLWGTHREANLAYMKAGVLKTVTNAYGGKAEFFYGAHSGISNVLGNVPSHATDPWYFGDDENDGLRIDSIVESERFNMNNSKVTEFQYSGGQRFMQGGYFHYLSKLIGTDSTATEPMTRIMTANFLSPHQMVGGSNHGYTNVGVLIRTGGGVQLSRKEIKFSNFQDAGGQPKYLTVGSGINFYTYPYTDKQYLMDWAMGLPLEITEYDQDNLIVQKTINKYTYTLDTASAIGKVDNQRIAQIPVSSWAVPGLTSTQGRKSIRDFYHPYTGAALLDSTIVRKYIADNAFVADTVRYHYDSRNNMDIVWARNSKGEVTETRQAYNYTLNSPAGSTLQLMSQAGLEKMVGTERWILGGSGATSNKLVDAFFNTFHYQDGKLSPKYLYNVQTGSPLTYAQYTGYTGGPALPESFAQLTSAFAGTAIPYFVKTSEVTLSDNQRNPLETRLLGQDLYKAMIWDTLTGRKIAEANCRFSDIAYTGFETSNKGNWEYNSVGSNIYNDAVSGARSYISNYGPVTRSGLTASKEYVISFWSGNYGGAPTCTIGGSTVTLTAMATQGTASYYEGRFTAPSSASVLSVSAPWGNFMDELRLFPADATMQCWSYKGMFGLSSETAPNGRVSYYEYDKMGRQTIMRDQDRNIISKTDLHIEQ